MKQLKHSIIVPWVPRWLAAFGVGRFVVPRVDSAAAVAAPRELHQSCSPAAVAAVAAVAGETAVAGKSVEKAAVAFAAAAVVAVVAAAAGSKEGNLEADLCLNFPATSMAATGCSGCSE